MQVATYLAQYTGLPVATLYNPDNVLVDPHLDASGNWTFPIWRVDGKAPPSSDEMNAAMAAPEPAAKSTQYDFLSFLSLFTQAEQAAIVSSADAQVRLFCLMAAGASFVDLTDPRVVTGTNQLETLGLIGKGRAAQVLAGQVPSA